MKKCQQCGQPARAVGNKSSQILCFKHYQKMLGIEVHSVAERLGQWTSKEGASAKVKAYNAIRRSIVMEAAERVEKGFYDE